jgi:hypothetical protein
MQLKPLDERQRCSIFVLMLHGHPLSAVLPEESGLGERFWYWRGASGQRYIHSIYRPDLCPSVPGAVFVVVRARGGIRQAVAVGRFPAEGRIPRFPEDGHPDDEVHVHLLARDEQSASEVLADLLGAMCATLPTTAQTRLQTTPVQLELLAA